MVGTKKGSSENILVIPNTTQDRYATFGFISWWNQDVIRQSSVLVAGAGALGNEVLKNLALLGVGHIYIIDFDKIEVANLSRSVLFREQDEGKFKAEVAANAIKQINPDIEVYWTHADLNYALGHGFYRRMNIIISCLDNIEARLSINRACWKVGRSWIDGATQEFLGEVRVFVPGHGSCFECTLGPLDYQRMNIRYSCSLLARESIQEGKIPTTPTLASIIGSLQTQEMLKILHRMEVKPGTALVFNGIKNDIYNIAYPLNPDCMSHEVYDSIEECPQFSATKTTVGEFLTYVRKDMGSDATIELDYDLLVNFECVRNHPTSQILQPISLINKTSAICPACGSTRWPHTIHIIDSNVTFLDETLAKIGIPDAHILTGKLGNTYKYFALGNNTNSLFRSI